MVSSGYALKIQPVGFAYGFSGGWKYVTYGHVCHVLLVTQVCVEYVCPDVRGSYTGM